MKIEIGDRVIIKENAKEIFLNNHKYGWVSFMDRTINKTGTISSLFIENYYFINFYNKELNNSTAFYKNLFFYHCDCFKIIIPKGKIINHEGVMIQEL